MKRTLHFLAFLTLLPTLSSCMVKANSYSKKDVTKEIRVNAFNSLVSSGVADIIYTQEKTTHISVKAPEDYIHLVKVSQKGKTLYISTQSEKRKEAPKVTITMSSPELVNIEASGVGDIDLKGATILNQLTIDNRAVGDINIENLTCKNIHINTRSVGDIRLGGTADTATYQSAAVGDIDAYNFKVGSLVIKSSAVGNIKCNASELSIDNNGIGNINYKGAPVIKKIKNNGVGSIKSKK